MGFAAVDLPHDSPSSVASMAARRPSVNCTAGTFRAPFMSAILPAMPTISFSFSRNRTLA